MSVRYSLSKYLRCLLVTLAFASPLLAQSYESSFSDVKFDRAKGPATFNAGVQVDAATGAMSMDVPFGPGIGERGLKFVPTLRMRLAPQLAISSSDIYLTNYPEYPDYGLATPQTLDSLYQRSYGTSSFTPGTFDLALNTSPVLTGTHQHSYSLPDGSGGYNRGVVPSEMTPSAAQALLSRFGLPSTETIGFLPGTSSRTVKNPFIQMGSSGHLILGLRTSGASNVLTDEVQDWIQFDQYKSGGNKWDFPRRILVVQGDVAYLFSYVSHRYEPMTIPYFSFDKSPLSSAHYMLTQIRNRFGEDVSFTYDADGMGYTATWSTDHDVKIRVQYIGTTSVATMPDLRSEGPYIGTVNQLRVTTYRAASLPVSSILLNFASVSGFIVGDPPGTGAAAMGVQRSEDYNWGGLVAAVQPSKITRENTGETIQFVYGDGPRITWSNFGWAPTVLTQVKFPNRAVSLGWWYYPYRWSHSSYRRPAYAYGVNAISDVDLPSGQIRETVHERTVPQMNWVTGVPSPSDLQVPEAWISMAFHDAITHPDGQITLHRFVIPPTDTKYDDLASIKALEFERRYYGPGTSKWNKIEHRLFSFITSNWRGEPLRDYETIVNLIARTTTAKGLKVTCRLDRRRYPTGRRVSDEEMENIHVERNKFHGDWNYVIKPKAEEKS